METHRCAISLFDFQEIQFKAILLKEDIRHPDTQSLKQVLQSKLETQERKIAAKDPP